MNSTFEGIWADLRNRLRAGTVVRNWSADRGYTGGEFDINDVDGSAIVVRSGQMGQERRVGRGDFVRVMGRIQSRYRQPVRTRQAFSEHDLRAEHSALARGYPERGTANHTATFAEHAHAYTADAD